jgi:small subunit ribosomal protein S1
MNSKVDAPQKAGAELEESGLMADIVSTMPEMPKKGDLVAGKVIDIDKSAAFIDLDPFGTGIIYGREFNVARDIIKNLNIGDEVDAAVVEEENEDGYIELSLKEARQALIWAEAEVAMKEKKVLSLPVKDANKGGVILEWQSVQGFVPASQLNTDHYPRVADGDKDAILIELEKLIGKNLQVTVLSIDPKEGKLIFSEKAAGDEEKQEKVERYEVGDKVKGEITGIVDFGVFIRVEDGLEGLAHISELDWGLVEDPHNLFKVGDKVEAQVIEVKEGKISLSIKRLRENPWESAKGKFKKGSRVEGVIIKYNKYGALASIEEGVSGLVHISEFGGDEEKLKSTLELGKTYPFIITVFEPEAQRMALSHQAATAQKEE